MWTEVDGSLWRGEGRRYGEVRILYDKRQKIKRTDLEKFSKRGPFMQYYIIHVIILCTALFVQQLNITWYFLTKTKGTILVMIKRFRKCFNKYFG